METTPELLAPTRSHDELVRVLGSHSLDSATSVHELGISPEEQMRLAHGSGAAPYSLAGLRELETETQQALARSDDLLTKMRLAVNPGTGIEAQYLLLRDPEAVVLEFLASNQNLHPEVVMGMPVADLLRSVHNKERVADALERFDAEVRAALEPGWAGTLEQLVEACQSFSQ